MTFVQIDGDAINASRSSIATNALEGGLQGIQVDTTCQGMCFALGQSRSFPAGAHETKDRRVARQGLRGECFLATLLSPGRPDDPDAGTVWERLTIPVKTPVAILPTTVSPFGPRPLQAEALLWGRCHPRTSDVGPSLAPLRDPCRFVMDLWARSFPGCPGTAWDFHRSVW